MTMADVAHASGFASIRSFNDTVRAVYAATPSELRRAARARDGARSSGAQAGGAARLALRLPFRAPLHASSLFGHLVATVVPGVEVWRADGLEVALALPRGPAVVRLGVPAPGTRHVPAVLRLSDVRDLAAAIQRCRRLLDLDADPHAVDEHLAADPALRPLVARAPGVRLPGSADAAQTAVRAVLGQQVSTARAAALAAQLVGALGTPLPPALLDEGGPTHLFPTADAVAGAEEAQLPGMPGGRRRALRAVAAAVAGGDLDLSPGADRATAREGLLALPGVGPWTAEIVALRGLGDPDAFPGGDLGVRASAAAAGLDARALALRAEGWRPWRSYAVALLWASGTHAGAGLPAGAPAPHTRTTTEDRPTEESP